MKLEWTDKNGDAEAHGGNKLYPELFDIEQAGESSFWAFQNGRPVGTYQSMEKAKERCQLIQDKITSETPPNHL